MSAVYVKTIFQDSQDFIWIGTQDGLNRYDGYHIKTFKTNQNSKTAVSSNDINCMFEDKLGKIYIGTNDGGMSVFNKYTETFTNYKSGLGSKKISSNSVRHIEELNDNELLIATEDGLNLFNKSTNQFNHIKCNNISATDLKFIFKNSKNRIFIASFGNGLFEYKADSKTLVNYDIPDVISGSLSSGNSNERFNLRCITEANGNIWWF
ncbi:MAG: hypothetical protein IPH32_12100 [Bacteroidetes bacterium]|nr:hypothetical protein [Bacteroidota bacterium]